MRQFLLVILGMFFLISCLFADVDYFSALAPGSSAQMISLGNIEGMSETSVSVFENPASLFKVKRFSSSFFTTTLMNEVVYLNGSVAMRFRNSVLGFGFMEASVRDIPRTGYALVDGEDNFFVRYNFDYVNSLYKLSYQLSTKNSISYGLTGTYYSVLFDTVKGSAFNMDFGMFFDAKKFDFSVVFRNFLSSSKMIYSDTDDEVPCAADFELCSSSSLEHWNNSDGKTETLSLETIYSVKYKMRNLSLLGQFKMIGSKRNIEKSFGVFFNPTFLKFLTLSAGIRQFEIVQSINGDVSAVPHQSKTFGMGLDLLGLNFDYTYGQSSHVEFQHKHYFSLSIGL